MSAVSRVACIHLPALPLQLLLADHPDWEPFPMAVVDRDAPTGKVLWVNQRAWHLRLRPGMRYAAALSLASELRAGVVSPGRVEEAIDGVAALLGRFSPSVEASTEHSGLFWVSASGLGRLYPSLEAWADGIEKVLTERGYRATIVVGFERFAASALALARHKVRVQPSAQQERQELMRVPLERLGTEPALLEALHRLGIRTLGQLLRLPRAKVAKRFGEAAERLYVQAHEGALLPVQARHATPEVESVVDLGYPERNSERLMHRIRSVLPGLVGQLLERGDALAELRIGMTLERGVGERAAGAMTECIKPASPTLDEALILDLVRLRLESIPLPTGVTSLSLLAIPTRVRAQQPGLLAARPKRDLSAADRALARLRAELGEDSVGTLVVADGHLPEAQMQWVPIRNLRHASPDRRLVRPMIRRIAIPPPVLPPRPRHEPDGWLVRGPEDGPVVRSTGPQIVSGGWWSTEIQREYHYLETARGMLLWTFFDRRRRRWYLQGVVE